MDMRKQISLIQKAAVVVILMAAVAAIFAFVVATSGCASSMHLNEQNTTATVTGKFIDTGTEGSGDSKRTVSYYVVVTDKGCFEIKRANEWLDTGSNPDMLYGNLKEGKTYEFKTYGYRVENWPGAYEYPIIVAYREV